MNESELNAFFIGGFLGVLDSAIVWLAFIVKGKKEKASSPKGVEATETVALRAMFF